MTINSNIIFTIGSKLGPGGFASLKAGIDLIGNMIGKVKESIEGLDSFAQAWKRTNKEAVLMADSAAAGLIDTGSIIKQHNALMLAGVKLTDQQFRTIAVRSVEMAKATGEDATQAFERLAKSIQTGSTRALREYGVDLKTSGTLTERQTEAVEKLTKGHENLSVAAETTTERLFALNNNWETMNGLVWEAVGNNKSVADGLDSLNSAIEIFNTNLAQSPKAMEKFVSSGEALKGFIAELELQVLEMAESSLVAAEKVATGRGVFGTMSTLLFGTEPVVRGKGKLEQRIDALRESLKQTSREALEVAENLKRTIVEEPTEGPTEGPGRRRVRPGEPGGERRLFDEGQTFLEQDLAQARQFEEFRTQQEKARLEREKERKERRAELRAEETEAEAIALVTSTERQEEYFLYLDELEEKAHWRKLGRFETMMGVEQQYIAASSKQWASGLQGKAQMMGTFFGSVAQLMNTESEKMFKIGKAAAIAEAVVNTYLGAIKAYQAMAGIPYVGPALGAAAAAAVVAAGVAAISNISRQQFRGGESGTGAAATASRISSNIGSTPGRGATNIPSGAAPSGATAQTQGEQKITVNIVMRDGGAGLFDVVMDQNESAGKDGRRYFATTGV